MFDIGGDTAALEFAEGTALAGATVRVSLDMSVRDFLALQRNIAGISTNAEAMTSDTLDSWEKAYIQFAERSLLSWDLSRNGVDIPATVDGFLSLPFAAANAVFTAWASALAAPVPSSVAVSDNGTQPETA